MLSRRLLLIAFAYFVLGIGLGIYMGAAQDFRFTHVHAHLNLLGWVALALIALAGRAFPELERDVLLLALQAAQRLRAPLRAAPGAAR